MKRKAKLITTFASLGLALALMAYGVFAATSQSIAVTNTITFTATKDIAATVYGTKSAAVGAAPTGVPTEITADPTTGGAETETAYSSTVLVTETTTTMDAWALSKTTLDVTNKFVVYTFTIQNDAITSGPAANAGQDFSINVKFLNSIDNTKVQREVRVGGNKVTEVAAEGAESATHTIAKITDKLARGAGIDTKGAKITFEVIYNLYDISASINAVDYSFSIELKEATVTTP
ncbi:MAG: hypothetical protein RR140_03575 [Clostridia bacterium]